MTTLIAFSVQEAESAHDMLAAHVAYMMGRKFEENDWTSVYCRAKGIPDQGWSNLNLDVIHGNRGVEHKMLCVKSGVSMLTYCGTSLMHPAATRSIRIPPVEDPDVVMTDVLGQYAELIESRRIMLQANDAEQPPDLRTGWLLWQRDLREFLYFEEHTEAPEPSNYWAEWRRSGGGLRKPSRNLWVYERQTGRKRYSVTTEAGAKIQPYFDVPPPNDPALYHFVVQGETIQPGYVRLWLTASTALELRRALGECTPQMIEQAIDSLTELPAESLSPGNTTLEPVEAVQLSEEHYRLLRSRMDAVSDEHAMRLLVAWLSSRH